MESLSNKQKILAIAAIVIVAGVVIYYYINSTKKLYDYNDVDDLVSSGETENVSNSDMEDEEEKIIVHVTGAVQNNGVVEVSENARINDVIEAAGGVTDDADLSDVNLAYKVEDGQKIYIPSISDSENTSDDTDSNIINDEAGSNVLSGDTNSSNLSLININTATQSELETLPGIGSSTASKIISYREENGKFKSIEDIKNVSRYW